MTPAQQNTETKNAPASCDLQIEKSKLDHHLYNEFMSLISLSARDCDQDELQLKMHRALRLHEELDPKDGIESMLARQMIGIHNAQHECLSKALHPEINFNAKMVYLDKVTRLSEVFLKQVQAINKHRGHASQRVTVEHVTVESGGQAIVGNVSQKGAKS